MTTMRAVRNLAIALVLGVHAGCAMRVSGIVVDAHTFAPIAGAMITANDGRDRVRRSNATGDYAIKTDAHTVSMNVAAPGYQPITVAIPSGSRHPTVQIDLVPLESARKAEATVVPISIVPVATRSTAQELEELERLYDQGRVTADEYKRMRARIVDRH
jgi:hypothetical protein